LSGSINTASKRLDGAKLSTNAAIVAAIGLLLSALGLTMDPQRFSYAWLWAYLFFWSAALGGLFFVALQHLTGSIWSVVIRRVAESFAAQMWVVALFAVPILAFAWFGDSFHLFPWLDVHHVEGDEVLAGKQPYLNVVFLSLRIVVFMGVWVLASHFFVTRSLAQDAKGAGRNEGTKKMRSWAPAFMLFFGLSVTFTGFDLMMSLDPHWFSTIFGVYTFAGVFVTGLAVIILGVVFLRSRGVLDADVVRPDHLHSLGGLLFAFSCFWAYIAFSQYMLIWYGHLPEETSWYTDRFVGGWGTVSGALAIVRWVIPFFLLLSRKAKTSPRRLALVSVIAIFGQLLDLYWVIMPQLHTNGPVLSWPELGPLLAMGGILVWLLTRFFARHPAMAVGDPLLTQSVEYRL